MEVSVIVLGDIARSPRMVNHVTLLLQSNFKVNLIGYQDSTIPQSLLSNPNLKIQALKSKSLNSLKALSPKVFIVYAFLRLFFEAFQLLFILLRNYKSKIFFIQNPPSMPILAIAYCVSCVYNTTVIVDWHNYAWSLLKIAKRGNLIVKIAHWYEWIFGKFIDSGFSVSQHMQKDLKSQGILTSVLYDRPFPRVSSHKNMKNYLKIPENYFFIVSSTSWTIDEDFSIVLNALDLLSHSSLQIFLLITGKGPLQEHYKKEIQMKNWKNIRIEMAWLDIEDYPEVLKQADLGICLHVSSSGVDLPMKVVDMQEAELPCLAYKYKSIHEFVQEGLNGDLFENSEELAHKIKVLAGNKPVLARYKKNLQLFRAENQWENYWRENALKIFEKKGGIKLRFCLFWVIFAILLFKLFVF